MYLQPGQIVAGRYRLLRQVGAGGMSNVWAARHELIGRDVAIKFIASTREAPEVTQRFLREARIIGKFKHPNIVGILDAGELTPGHDLFLVMELLDGVSLADLLTRRAVLGCDLALGVLREVCRGLEVAHGAGVVHRDVKPENIILSQHPAGGVVPKIVDFGISKSSDRGEDACTTMVGQILGTPAYMSPEQALGRHDIDGRADLWAMGVMLHEAVCGRQPFTAGNNHALLLKIIEDDAPPLPAAVPAKVRAIVERCLRKAPEERFASAAELGAALERARLELPEPFRAPDPSISVIDSADEALPPPSSAGSLRPPAGAIPPLSRATFPPVHPAGRARLREFVRSNALAIAVSLVGVSVLAAVAQPLPRAEPAERALLAAAARVRGAAADSAPPPQPEEALPPPSDPVAPPRRGVAPAKPPRASSEGVPSPPTPRRRVVTRVVNAGF